MVVCPCVCTSMLYVMQGISSIKNMLVEKTKYKTVRG